jgi:mannose-6-phosphate isomerase-like protein (cupin superfamily)
MTMAEDKQDTSKMQIFRAKDAPGLMEAKCMSVEPFTAVQRAGMDKALAAGYLEGDEIKVLCQLPGFSLTHVWFKEGYSLPLHSHDCECLYYIIAGSLKLGTEELGPRDSFFIPTNVPYTYKPGPGGVELLEIRHANAFNFVNLAKGEAFWEKAVEQTAQHRDGWKTATRPSLNA